MDAPVISIPGNTPPEGGRAIFLTSDDGVRLRAMSWMPAVSAAQPRGTIFLLNGRSEFIEKYFQVAGELLSRGFAVATLDWRGQGLSDRLLDDPRKGHIDDFGCYLRDLDVLLRHMAPVLPAPHLALAHSMGAHILLRAAHDRPHMFAAIVLGSPMFGLPLGGPMLRSGLRILAASLRGLGGGHNYVPGGGRTAIDEVPFEGNLLTSDLAHYGMQVALVKAQPLFGLGAPTIDWINAAFRSMQLTSKPDYLKDIQVPLLMLLAGQDRLVDNEAALKAAHFLPNMRLVTIAGAQHEILMEKDRYREDFWRAFDEFTARF